MVIFYGHHFSVMIGSVTLAMKEAEVVDTEVAIMDRKDIAEITDLVMVVIMRDVVIEEVMVVGILTKGT